jgi:Domain of unknown function (DUF4386)
MATPNHASRLIGVLILAQMVGGGVVNFVLAAPLFGAPGFLVNAAANAVQIAVSALVGMAVSGLAVAIAIIAYPIVQPRSLAMALWFLALAIAGLAVSVIEHTTVMSMLSLSEAYTKVGAAAEREQFQALRVVVASARNWTHYLHLIVAGSTLFVFYAALFRFALVPRALAAFGLAAVLLQIVAVAMPLFGHEIVFPLLAPLGLCQLLLAIWLITKGLPSTAPSVR